MSEKPINADELFGEFENDASYREERRRLAPHTNLGVNVNRLRTARGWTQKELARAAGMKQPRIAEIERGDANPQLETIVRLAIALGVKEGDLLRDPSLRDEPVTSRRITISLVPGRSAADQIDWGAVSRESARVVAANENFALAS